MLYPSPQTRYGFFFTTLSSHETLANRLDLLFDDMQLEHLDLIVSEDNQALVYQAASTWAQHRQDQLTLQFVKCPQASALEILADNTHEEILTAYIYQEEDGYTPISYACAEQLDHLVTTLKKLTDSTLPDPIQKNTLQ